MAAYEKIRTSFPVLKFAGATISQQEFGIRQVFPVSMQDSHRQTILCYRGNFSSRSPWKEPI
jgi:hypothetical protein